MNLKSKTRKEANFWQCLKLAVVDTFWEYTFHSKGSGVWLLRPNRTRNISRLTYKLKKTQYLPQRFNFFISIIGLFYLELLFGRWCWSFVMITLFLGSVYLSLQLWLKFYSHPILNTISNYLPITDVAFPGITICSPKVMNAERVRRYIRSLDIPKKYDIEEVISGFEYLDAFTSMDWIRPKENSSAYLVTDEVLRLNNVSLYDATMQVSAGCEDFAKHCFWGNLQFSCQQNHEYLSFMPTTSYLGPCCSFNYNPRSISYVPFSSNIFGINGGLTVIGEEGSENNISTGLVIFVHNPKDFVTEASPTVAIATNSENFVEIAPIVHSSSMEVLELSQSKRDCLISGDLALTSYRQSSCIEACISQLILEKCKCQPYHLPNAKLDQECKLKDALCYSQMYESIKSIQCDQCLPNCYDVTYSISTYKADLLQHNHSISSIYSFTNFTKDSFIVRFYLANQIVQGIHKVTIMSWISLLSDLGGVFNLCLGLSMISVVECFYYCTWRLRVNYKIRKVLMQ